MSVVDDSSDISNHPVGGTGGSGSAGAEEAVKVFVRMRPLSKREIESSRGGIIWDFNENSVFEDTQTGTRVYTYDHCFGPTSSNRETYELVAKPIVHKVLDGYNGTVLACKNKFRLDSSSTLLLIESPHPVLFFFYSAGLRHDNPYSLCGESLFLVCPTFRLTICLPIFIFVVGALSSFTPSRYHQLPLDGQTGSVSVSCHIFPFASTYYY